MNLKVTEEELQAINLYKNEKYIGVNQLLEEDVETDIALLKAGKNIEYSEDIVIEDIEIVAKIYEAMVKSCHENEQENWSFFRCTNMGEIDRLNIKPEINRFLPASENLEKVKANIWNNNNPVIVEIYGDKNIPYFKMDDDVVIAPFTKLNEVQKISDAEIYNNAYFKSYKIYLGNQEFVHLEEHEKDELYSEILKNADMVNRKIKDCIEIDSQNEMNHENLRKLEKLLEKHHFVMEQEDYVREASETEKQEDKDNIERINRELESLKNVVAENFAARQECVNFITEWKLEVIKFIMSECSEIKNRYEVPEIFDEQEIENEVQENVEEESSNVQEVNKEEIDENLTEESEVQEDKKELEPEVQKVFDECQENIAMVNELLCNIRNLICKQQNHARIAESMDSNYRALNNAFEMKNYAEELEVWVSNIAKKVEEMSEEEQEELDKISKVNIQISTLLNYLNNAKSAIGKKVTRFDEINIIEENELKREIAETIKNIRCEAELKKLNDDIDIIEEQSGFKKFIGRFTGKNKLNEVMLDQIQIRQTAIRKTFKNKMPLAYNYSIHQLIAEIEMFVKENEDDDLVCEEVCALTKIRDILKKNFVIIDSKVISIIDQKTGKNLPLASRKLSKKELIEIDTYRFLNKYGYDKTLSSDEPEYQDTLAHEIKRIVDYIKSSEIL